MKEKFISTKINVYSYSELSDENKNLIDLAKEATTRSYAPYSKFSVGAALLLSNGEIVTGSNQENAAFPSGTCAERTAIYYAHSQYPAERVVKLAIAAFYEGSFLVDPISPCGACRQAILEYEKLGGLPIEILLYGEKEIYILEGIKSLLPLQFDEF
ncbi:MAG: cytidine deaminase [Muribaculaceae bacterium]